MNVIINSERRKRMNRNDLIGKEVINKNNEVLVINEVEWSDDIKGVVIKLSNKKIFNLFLSYKSGFIRMKDEKINKELEECINEDNRKIEIKKQIEKENRLKEIELERKEKERLDTAIKKFRDKYFFLSNFYIANVTYKGITYNNNEAAFQAQKDLTRSLEFKDLNPMSAKRLGKRVKLREDWESIKLNIMEEIIRCKFDQNPELKEKLLNTEDLLLIEGNDWNDTYWGVCRGKGLNNLGKLLMKVRDSYKN